MTRIWPAISAACLLTLCGCGDNSAVAKNAASGGSPARRSVKTGTDPDAAKINMSPVATTVEEIAAQKSPDNLAGRQGPFETTTWKVSATIESVQLKKDGDYYLVVKGDKGGSTVVEVPDPKQCEGSPMHDQIAATRQALEDRYHPTDQPKEVNEKATITGVGFLGWGSKGKGATGKSGARLMPGTGVEFKK